MTRAEYRALVQARKRLTDALNFWGAMLVIAALAAFVLWAG